MIHQYIIALGSNHNSKISFDITIGELKRWGEVVVSSVVVGKDFTGNTELMYHNAVMMMDLYEPMGYDELNGLLKNIEKYCGRADKNAPLQTDASKTVPMDLDILAFYDDGWHLVKKRLPFKAHEKLGLIEVAPFLSSDLT